ncbi:MAG: hypothetical protein LUQ07_07545 [Methanospirillum sp.]|nr:hypothetical protein [Methanospirillum sp.]
MYRFLITVCTFCFIMAGTAWADTTDPDTNERPVLTIYPYTIGQLPPTFYGETSLPVGEELTVNITRFPDNSQGEAAVIRVLSAEKETKPSFTPETAGMNKWLYTGDIANYTFGAYKVVVSASNEDISAENIFRIKQDNWQDTNF